MVDLADFGRSFDVHAEDAVAKLIAFASELTTNVGAAQLQRRQISLRQGKARVPPNSAEHALMGFAHAPSFLAAIHAFMQIQDGSDVRVYRPEIFRGCLAALRAVADGSCTFHEAPSVSGTDAATLGAM